MKKRSYAYFSQIICSIIGKGSFLLVTLLLFKALTLAEMAVFALVYAIATILATISECGMRGLLVREMSRIREKPEQSEPLISGTIWSRLWTLFPYFAVGSVAGYFLVPAGYWAMFFMIMGTVWLDSNSQVLRGILRAYDFIALDASVAAASRVLLLLITAVLFFSSILTLGNFCVTWLAVSASDLLISIFIIALKTKVKFSFTSTRQNTLNLLKRALPFTVLAIIGILYLRMGILILAASGTQEALEETAGFNLSGRIPEGVSFLPIAVMNATIPFLARSSKDHDLLTPLFRGLEVLIGGAGIIISVGLVCFSGPLILLLSVPEYLQFNRVFQIYAVTVVFSFLQYIYSNLLLCMDQEHRVAKRYGSMLVANVILNLLLVWKLGALGAAIALLLCEITAVLIDLAFLRDTRIPASIAVLRKWAAICVACLAFVGISQMFDGLYGLVCYLILGGALGLFLLYMTEKRRHTLEPKSQPI